MLELSEKIKGHFRNPQNVGEIENPEGMGTINNPVCGDTTKLYLKIRNGVVEDAKFLSFGCAVTIASASVFTTVRPPRLRFSSNRLPDIWKKKGRSN
jgi:nitrogen fixation NifU-like protein